MDSASSSGVRLAIIGTGGISREHALGVLGHPDRVECVALCDVSDENLRVRNAQLGGGCRLYHDWNTLLAEMGDGLDAVDICLPHHLHAAAITAAAREGAAEVRPAPGADHPGGVGDFAARPQPRAPDPLRRGRAAGARPDHARLRRRRRLAKAGPLTRRPSGAKRKLSTAARRSTLAAFNPATLSILT